MIYQSELELEHALNAVTLHQKIRSLLATTFTEQEKWSNEVIELITCIEKSLQHTPDNYYPTEWKLMIAGLRVLASQITCEKIAETGQGNLIEEETKCRTLQAKLRRLLNNNLNLT